MKGKIFMRLHAARLIGTRGFKSAVGGFGPYLVAFTGCLAAAFIINTYAEALQENGILILSNPLNFALYFIFSLTAVYIAFMTAISVARERDSGTLEVLFFGPVDEVAYILGKFLEAISLYTVMLFLYLFVIFLFVKLTAFGLSANLIWSIIYSLAFMTSVAALGIFFSSIAIKMRNAVLLLILFFTVVLSVQWVNNIVAGLDPLMISPALSFAASILYWSARVMAWISPFAYLDRGMRAILLGDLTIYLENLVFVILYGALLLSAAVLMLRKKGVNAG